MLLANKIDSIVIPLTYFNYQLYQLPIISITNYINTIMDALEIRAVKISIVEVKKTVDELKKTLDHLVQLNKDKMPHDKPIKTKKPKKTTDTKSDDEVPKKKRLPSGYLLYINSIRAQVKTELGEENGPKDVTRELAKRWKALDDEERIEWNDKSKAMKDSDTD